MLDGEELSRSQLTFESPASPDAGEALRILPPNTTPVHFDDALLAPHLQNGVDMLLREFEKGVRKPGGRALAQELLLR